MSSRRPLIPYARPLTERKLEVLAVVRAVEAELGRVNVREVVRRLNLKHGAWVSSVVEELDIQDGRRVVALSRRRLRMGRLRRRYPPSANLSAPRVSGPCTLAFSD